MLKSVSLVLFICSTMVWEVKKAATAILSAKVWVSTELSLT
jgi:hypothetical protein